MVTYTYHIEEVEDGTYRLLRKSYLSKTKIRIFKRYGTGRRIWYPAMQGPDRDINYYLTYNEAMNKLKQYLKDKEKERFKYRKQFGKIDVARTINVHVDYEDTYDYVAKMQNCKEWQRARNSNPEPPKGKSGTVRLRSIWNA